MLVNDDVAQKTVSGVVISGGRAERMNRQEKGLQLFKNKPMVLWVAEQLEEAAGYVMINANRQLESYRDFGFELIADLPDFQDIGPLSGVMTALLHAKSDYLIVSPCDTPYIRASAFMALYQESLKQPDKIHFLSSQSGSHPLHAILPVRSARSELMSFLEKADKKSVMAFYKQHGCASLQWHNEDELKNINYLDQLASLS